MKKFGASRRTAAACPPGDAREQRRQRSRKLASPHHTGWAEGAGGHRGLVGTGQGTWRGNRGAQGSDVGYGAEVVLIAQGERRWLSWGCWCLEQMSPSLF